VEDQRKALEDAGALDPSQLYQDTVRADVAKQPARVRPEMLTERTALLRATRPRQNEVIAVATPLALGVSERDLIDSLAAAGKNRKAAVLFVDSGLRIAPDDGMAAAAVAAAAWQKARQDVRTKPGRIAGNVAAAAKKLADTEKKLPAARPLWRSSRPDRLTAAQVADKVGLSVKTLYSRFRARPRVKR
jgi:hypothetical protein